MMSDNKPMPLHITEEGEELLRLRAELATLKEQNANLKTVMIAAAEEIQEHWQAHCDEEGYGPSNLMHRLEKGIPVQYGYAPGDFERIQAELVKLRKEQQVKSEDSRDAEMLRWLISNHDEGINALLCDPDAPEQVIRDAIRAAISAQEEKA
jgi:hypothetical protein